MFFEDFLTGEGFLEGEDFFEETDRFEGEGLLALANIGGGGLSAGFINSDSDFFF